MPLEVQHLTEADLLQWTIIHYEAFRGTTVGMCWARRPSDESFAERAKARSKALSDPNSHAFKCVDTDLNNKIIAVSQWSVYPKERTWEEVEEGLKPRPMFPEDRADVRKAFLTGIYNSRRENMGTRPHVILESLTTHPDHHRRGAGGMLLQWGIDQQDSLGLLGYLEGSSAGAPLYKKFGYEHFREIIFDTREYGGAEVDVHLAMTRQPKARPSKD
ncbi:hypothetical protein EJ08DRAFT_644771 [Tothia fuscella]|uniref:N-acetyltransferase domain-containing protein n=1 Tax=Tothia fuscella TaxID=1048955 RepID=A0A9P4U4Y8_9PEZI|nr:hypothetical protein EJ08DRAFT_644771 [Tothia fuscella]